MKRFLDIFLISVLVVLTIITGKLFIKVNNELDAQLKANDTAIIEDTDNIDPDLRQNKVTYSISEKEENELSLDSGQAYINEAYEEPQRRKDGLKNNLAEVETVQEKIAMDILEKEPNLDNRGRIDRRQQPRTQVAGISTLADLTVELLDWWEEADKLFEKGVPVVITDVETGKSFLAVRTYGANHADVETLTAEDTAIMLEIWGGEWNWERRAVTIKINGRKLAASASGMPHAGLDNQPEEAWVDNRSGGFGAGINLDKIKGNNMDGHFDIHFLNSRTHGTDRVDEAHQQKVQEAFAGGK